MAFDPNRINGDLRGLLGGSYQAQEGKQASWASPQAPPSAIAGEQSPLFDELMTRQSGEAIGAGGVPANGMPTPAQGTPKGPNVGGIGGGADVSGQQPYGNPPATGSPYQPSTPVRTPPAWERFQTAQDMIKGYQNGWEPNPILTRVLGGR